MTTLHAVMRTIGGFAREDADRPDLVGVYSDPVVARQVQILVGGGAVVVPVEVDAVSTGLVESARQLGMTLGKPRT